MTLDLPVNLLREAKVRAILEGKSFRDKLAELLTHGLDVLDAVGKPTPPRAPSRKTHIRRRHP